MKHCPTIKFSHYLFCDLSGVGHPSSLRSVAPASMGSSSTALYLCIRNLVGGLGPLGVALIAERLGGDLRSAMLLIPVAYIMSGVMFVIAEQKMDLNKPLIKNSMEHSLQIKAETIKS